MKSRHNLKDNSTIKKFQNLWVAFNKDKEVFASSKTYIKLHSKIPKRMKENIQVTFINASDAYLAPLNGSI